MSEADAERHGGGYLEYACCLRRLADFVKADHAREDLLTRATAYEALAQFLEHYGASVPVPGSG